MTAVMVFSSLCILLVLGKIVRVQLPVLQRLYLPSSVVGGIIGLTVFTLAGDRIPCQVREAMGDLPGFLINVMFATLYLGCGVPKIQAFARQIVPQLTLAQIVVWGQFVLGLGLCGFLLMPAFGVGPAFGNLLELGFEGGHGTVAGMTPAFQSHNWADGIALGYTVATVGMILGIVVGMMLVNWAYGKGYVKTVRPFSQRSRNERRGIHEAKSRPSAGHQTVQADSVDSLAWHIAIVGIAVLIGFGILEGCKAAEIALFPQAKTRLFFGFPLFPLCMLGGVLLQAGAKLFRVDLLVDREQMTRISGATLDFLALSAIATIKLSVIAANWMPLTIMVAAGVCWTVFATMFFGRRLFRESWFERSIAEFGQATGVTATGLLLLRTVDPENKTIAASSFAGKQLINEPMMGFWVAMAMALVFTVGWLTVFLISSVVLLVWLVIAWFIIRRNRA